MRSTARTAASLRASRERGDHLLGHARIEAVEDVGPVEHDREHAVLQPDLDVLVGHGAHKVPGGAGGSHAWWLPFPASRRQIGGTLQSPGLLRRHRDLDDARRASQDPPHAFPARRRPAVRLAADRVQRARVARAGRPRGDDEPEQDDGAARASGALSVLVARARSSARRSSASLLDHPHDAASAYYRSRPLLLTLGLSLEDALGSPLGRAGGFSDGRDIGVVGNLPNRDGPMRAADGRRRRLAVHAGRRAGRSRSVYQRDTLRRSQLGRRDRASVLGGEASVGDERLLVGADDRDDAEAADAVLHRRQRARHLGEGRSADAGREHRARTSRRSATCSCATATAAIRARRRVCSRSASSTCAAARGRRSCDSPCRGCAATPDPTIRRAIARKPRSRRTRRAIRCRDCGSISCRRSVAKTIGPRSKRDVARDVKARRRGGARAAGPRPADVKRFIYAEPRASRIPTRWAG